MAKTYDVCVPRQYKDRHNGQVKTSFWKVGTAFPLQNREGFSIKLNSKMILTDQYVVFPRDPREAEDEPPGSDEPWDDDIPR